MSEHSGNTGQAGVGDAITPRASERDAVEPHRITIEQAKGAVSGRFGVTTDDALQLLAGLARSQRRELHEFAAEVVRNRGRLDGDVEERLDGGP